MKDFDSKVWDAGYEAAEREHKQGIPCSRSLIQDITDLIDNPVDFRNGMTAYRDEHNLPDDEFDMPHS